MLERADLDYKNPNNPGMTAFVDNNLILYKWAAEFLATLDRPLHIVDAASGCGAGYDHLSPHGCYLGLDASGGTVFSASNRRPRACFQVRDLEMISTFLPFAGIVDVWVTFETIEHLKKPDDYLSMIRWALDENRGYLILSAPTSRTRDWDPYHIQERSHDQWRTAIQSAGFEIVQEKTSKFEITFREFCRTMPTTLWQKLQIARYNLLHPRYFVDRLWNWVIRQRFRWSSGFFVAKVKG